MRPSKNVELMKALAVEIKARRGELDLTQEALAMTIDIDRPYVTLIEGARKQPTLSVIWRLASGLELRPEEFVRRVDARLAAASSGPMPRLGARKVGNPIKAPRTGTKT